jgi:hypothetical protein
MTEQSSVPIPQRGKYVAEGQDDTLHLHKISTLLIQASNPDEQLHEISTLLIQEGNLDALYDLWVSIVCGMSRGGAGH